MAATVDETPRAGAPWHFWVVAVLGLLWNGYGAYDYTMSHLQKDAYFQAQHMSDAQIAYQHAMPSWMHAVWAIGVWGSVAGAVLLLLRMRWAFHAYAISMLGVVGLIIYSYVLNDSYATGGMMGVVLTAAIAGICLFLLWYSRLMTKRGVLR